MLGMRRSSSFILLPFVSGSEFRRADLVDVRAGEGGAGVFEGAAGDDGPEAAGVRAPQRPLGRHRIHHEQVWPRLLSLLLLLLLNAIPAKRGKVRPADKLQVKAAKFLPLVELARSKQDPVNRLAWCSVVAPAPASQGPARTNKFCQIFTWDILSLGRQLAICCCFRL